LSFILILDSIYKIHLDDGVAFAKPGKIWSTKFRFVWQIITPVYLFQCSAGRSWITMSHFVLRWYGAIYRFNKI